MKEAAKGIRMLLGSALVTCIISLFLVSPRSKLFFLLFAISIIVGILWLITLGVKHS